MSDPKTGERVLSPTFESVAEAQAWQRDREEALWEPARSTRNGADVPPEPRERRPSLRGSRHSDEREPEEEDPFAGSRSNGGKPRKRSRVPSPDFEDPPEAAPFESVAEARAWWQDQQATSRASDETLTGRVDLASVVDRFLQAAEDGRARDRHGDPYGPARRRQLRGALSYAESALGAMSLEDVRHRHVEGMLDELRRSGMTSDNLASIAAALRSLYAYAVGLDLVGYSPVVEPSLPETAERQTAAPTDTELEGQEMGAVINDFLAAIERGRVVRRPGEPYTLESLRELRGALSYVDYELRTMDIRDVRRGHIKTLVDDLRSAGVPQVRVLSVVDALRSLYAFAIQGDLVDFSPVVELGLPFDGVVAQGPPAAGFQDDLPPRASQYAPGPGDWADDSARETQSPTAAMLALGGQVAKWTTRIVVIAFVLIVITIARALGVTEAIPFP